MLETCHILVGAAIAEKTQNPFLGLFFAFLSHYFIDFIPHEEYSVNGAEKIWKTPLKEILKVAADLSLGFLIVFMLSKNTILALAGGFFAIIPDMLTFLFYIFPKNKLLNIHYDIHVNKIHIFKTKIPFFWRIFTQIAVIVISVFFLLR
jgi:hypothetical protein